MAVFRVIHEAGKYQDEATRDTVLQYIGQPQKIQHGLVGGLADKL